MKKLLFTLSAALVATVSFAQANSANSMDYMGQQHNVTVEDFLAKYPGTGHTLQDITAKTITITEANPVLAKYKDATYKPADYKEIETASADYSNQFHNVISTLPLSTAGKAKTTEFIDYMFKLSTTTAYTPYQDFYNYVVTFEKGVSSNSALTAQDKGAILTGTSIARYSVSMWDKKYGGANQPLTASKRGFWGSLFVGVCDVAGGVYGYATSGGNVLTTIQDGASASTWGGEISDSVKGK